MRRVDLLRLCGLEITLGLRLRIICSIKRHLSGMMVCLEWGRKAHSVRAADGKEYEVHVFCIIIRLVLIKVCKNVFSFLRSVRRSKAKFPGMCNGSKGL